MIDLSSPPVPTALGKPSIIRDGRYPPDGYVRAEGGLIVPTKLRGAMLPGMMPAPLLVPAVIPLAYVSGSYLGSQDLASGASYTANVSVPSSAGVGVLFPFIRTGQSRTITSITLGSATPTQIGTTSNTGINIWAYYLNNPPTGSRTLSISFSSGVTIFGVAVLWFRGNATFAGNYVGDVSDPFSVTVSPTPTSGWHIFAFIGNDNGWDATLGGWTNRVNEETDANDGTSARRVSMCTTPITGSSKTGSTNPGADGGGLQRGGLWGITIGGPM